MRGIIISILGHFLLLLLLSLLLIVEKETGVTITEIELLPPAPEKQIHKKRKRVKRRRVRRRRRVVKKSPVSRPPSKNRFREIDIRPRMRREPVVPLTDTRLPTANHGRRPTGRLANRFRGGGSISPRRRSPATLAGIGGLGGATRRSGNGGSWHMPGLGNGRPTDTLSRIKLTNLAKAMKVGTRRVSRTVVKTSGRYVIISYPSGIAIRITRVPRSFVLTQIRRSRKSAPTWDMQETYHQAIYTLQQTRGK